MIFKTLFHNRLRRHHEETRSLAQALNSRDVYAWLVDHGYFPESYVLPPCFSVATRPSGRNAHYEVTDRGRIYRPPITECVSLSFPKTALTDRAFGIINPRIHNDIAYHLSMNWPAVVEAIFPADCKVVSYSFPVPLDSKHPGRLGELRSGRAIYEFLNMLDEDLAAEVYRYRFLVKADIKSFYPSIYTHSISWAFHGKRFIRSGSSRFDYRLFGNRLDKLFQNASDGRTNGIPIGPVVSDIVAEAIASSVDAELSELLKKHKIDCEVVRFKDDYRILVNSEAEGQSAIKCLQSALGTYHLSLSDEKTSISELPNGLFREWASMYHALQPMWKQRTLSWEQFRELYLAVLQIDKRCPGTGVIDRFLSDLVTQDGEIRIKMDGRNLPRVVSLLLMLSTLRIKAFPKVMAIIEAILKTTFGARHRAEIVLYLERHLNRLAKDEERNKYLISWICYFLVSNGLRGHVRKSPRLGDPLTKAVWNSRNTLFRDCPEYKVFVGCRETGARHSMLRYLDVFHPPSTI